MTSQRRHPKKGKTAKRLGSYLPKFVAWTIWTPLVIVVPKSAPTHSIFFFLGQNPTHRIKIRIISHHVETLRVKSKSPTNFFGNRGSTNLGVKGGNSLGNLEAKYKEIKYLKTIMQANNEANLLKASWKESIVKQELLKNNLALSMLVKVTSAKNS